MTNIHLVDDKKDGMEALDIIHMHKGKIYLDFDIDNGTKTIVDL